MKKCIVFFLTLFALAMHAEPHTQIIEAARQYFIKNPEAHYYYPPNGDQVIRAKQTPQFFTLVWYPIGTHRSTDEVETQSFKVRR